MSPFAEKGTQTSMSTVRWRRTSFSAGDRSKDACGSTTAVAAPAAMAAAKPCGKTSDGTAFWVPRTSDMVSSLFRFGDNKRKSVFDLATLAIMAAHVAAFFALPSSASKVVFFFLFCFWRLCYNVGLGILLKYQSERRGLVSLAQRWNLFGRIRDQDGVDGSYISTDSGISLPPPVRRFLREELSSKMGGDYDFDAVPVEFNTWLLFRALVDLVLMNDFTSYACFALSFVSASPESGTLPVTLRWITGLGLICFNLWVKVDAHRVVKDFAWYWGDFFFLIEADLTFDGVFEIYPHPMYSVGYAGYYGMSIITASYWVFFASLAAHATQFLFLVLVENPHIKKTYSQPAFSARESSEVKQNRFLLKLDEKKRVVRTKLDDFRKRVVRKKLDDFKKRVVRTRA